MVRVLGGRMMPPSRMKKQESPSSCFQQGHQTPPVSFFRLPFGIGRATRVVEWRNLTGTPGVQGRWCHRDSRHSGVSSILTWKPRSGDGVFCSLSLTSFLSLILRAPHHSWTTPWLLSRSLSAAGRWPQFLLFAAENLGRILPWLLWSSQRVSPLWKLPPLPVVHLSAVFTVCICSSRGFPSWICGLSALFSTVKIFFPHSCQERNLRV